MSVHSFEAAAPDQLGDLLNDVLTGRYVPEPGLRFEIPKAGRPGERRTLARLSVRDKILQEALRAALEPVAETTFADCSYAYRPGRGAARAARRASHHFTCLHHGWAAVADVDDFFGSLDHVHLLDNLRDLGVHGDLQRLVELWLTMGTVDGRLRWRDSRAGVPQGAIVSPLLANIYLTPFDRAMVASGLGLVRYADDFLVTAADEVTATAARAQAVVELGTLGLRLNPHDTPVRSLAQGIPFLGISFTQSGRHLGPERLGRCRAAITACLHRSGSVAEQVRRLEDLVDGWRHYYGSLLSPDALGALDNLLDDALTQWLVSRRAARQVTDSASALDALRQCAPVTAALPDERQRWQVRIVDRAFGSASRQRKTDTVPPTPCFPQSARRHGQPRKSALPPPVAGAASPLGATTTRLRPSAPAAVVVRRRKRIHLRAASQATELVVTTPGCFVGKTGERVVVRHERRVVWDAPITHVTGITVAAHGVAISTDVVHLCVSRGVPLCLIDARGHATATLTSPARVQCARAAQQLEHAACARRAAAIAGAFVRGKILNQLHLLRAAGKYRCRRDHGFTDLLAKHGTVVEACCADLPAAMKIGDLTTARATLMGIEGRAARSYWSAFAHIAPGEAKFEAREHRGARDLVNSLLNYGYAILEGRVHLAVVRSGLLPQVGFLHAEQQARASLVYDLMEEFRPTVVDRAVLAMLHRKEPACLENAGGSLSAPTKQRLLCRVKERLASPVRRHGRDEVIEEIIDGQTSLLARHLAGEARYRPFLAPW